MRYIALLRGVNVGGNNKIPMPGLKAAFEKEGFQQVKTYINSGNVIFESERSDVIELKIRCEKLILDTFGLSIVTLVISADALIEAVSNAPEWWGKDAESKHNAIFVIPPATGESVMRDAGAAKPEYEKVECYKNIIFWSAPLKTFSRTRWSKIVGTKTYDSVTIRNVNTAKKLCEMVK